MLKESEKRWQKMHGKKGASQYDVAAAAAHQAGASDSAHESRIDLAGARSRSCCTAQGQRCPATALVWPEPPNNVKAMRRSNSARKP